MDGHVDGWVDGLTDGQMDLNVRLMDGYCTPLVGYDFQVVYSYVFFHKAF